MRNILFLTVLASAALFAACNRPVPVAQDGTDLWLAASRPYSEILASVQADIDPALPAEAFHIYDADGQRHYCPEHPRQWDVDQEDGAGEHRRDERDDGMPRDEPA